MSLSSKRTRIAPPPKGNLSRTSGWRSSVAFLCLVCFLGLYSLHAVRPDRNPGTHHGKYQKVQVERLDNLNLPKVELEPVAIGLIQTFLQPITSLSDEIPATPLFRDHPSRAPPSLHS